MKGQLTEASSATSKAYCVYRREMDPEIDMVCPGPEAGSAEEKSAEEVTMSPTITIMQPILRFLQLLCENHNRELQVRLCSLWVSICSLRESDPGETNRGFRREFWRNNQQRHQCPIEMERKKNKRKNVHALTNKQTNPHIVTLWSRTHILAPLNPICYPSVVFVQEDHLHLISLSWF